MKEKPVNVFISYAHEDRSLLEQLEKHLALLQREGRISTWHDHDITAGEKWAHQIDAHLNEAEVILLLISANFWASDYCYSNKMKQAMKRHEAREARVIPIILRPCIWKIASLEQLQILPHDGKPITSSDWHNLDEAFYDVAQGIKEAVEAQIRGNPSKTMPNSPRKTTEVSTGSTIGEASNQTQLSSPLDTQGQSQQPSMQSSPLRKQFSSKWRAIYLGGSLFTISLLLAGFIRTFLITQGPSRPVQVPTATAQVTLNPTASLHGIQNYDTAVTNNGIQYGFDAQHTRFNVYEHILTSSKVKNLKKAWTAQTGDMVYSSPAVANDIVYVGSNDNSLYAFDVQTGTKLWFYPTGGEIRSSPAIANGMIYVGSSDKNLYAFHL